MSDTTSSSDPAGTHAGPTLTARSFTAGPAGADVDLGTIHYGPDIPTEAELRLLGHQHTGKRIVVLGSGSGAAAVTLARAGAKVIAVDGSDAELTHTRRLAEREEVKIELHHGDVADLAFLRADTVDLVLSIYVLGAVADIDRVYRQVHRILRSEGPFVFSVPHPVYRALDPTADPPTLARRYLDRTPIAWQVGGESGADVPRPIGELVTGLVRSNFRLDALLEPAPTGRMPRSRHWEPAMDWIPSTLIVRARKQGT
ncbi:MAG: class I SAM-dependent methyltransferase [Acidimicrobiales bacterium]